MKHLLLLSTVLMANSITGMQQDNPYAIVPSQLIKTIDDVPLMCTELVKKLRAQPLYAEECPPFSPKYYEEVKILALESWLDGSLVAKIHDIAGKGTKEYIFTYDHKHQCRHHNHKKPVSIGLQLAHEKKIDQPPIPSDQLLQTYQTIIHALKTNWVKAEPHHIDRIFNNKKHTEKWDCYIKQDGSCIQAGIIRTIIYKLGLQKDSMCESQWYAAAPKKGFGPGMPYLWVRISEQMRVQELLGFSS